MIPLTDLSWQSRPWQWLLGNAVTDISDLVRSLGLSATPANSDFPVLVPLPYLSRIRPGDPEDPLLLQVLPVDAENAVVPGFVEDPLEESASSPLPGLLHKYHGRVLVIVSGACGVNCRYCFRRHFPYQSFQPDTARWQEIARYVAGDQSIHEVILSGGDPLVLSDKRLASIANSLAAVEHVHTFRLHSRLPIVIPQRVCDELTRWIEATRLKVVMVLHSNHPRELDDGVALAMARLTEAGVTLLNQSVLLKGVNDDAATLIALSRRLFDLDIMPYYLHLLDPVQGAAHFEVNEAEARHLIDRVAASLPGYLVPRLVREVPGAPNKLPR